MFVPTYVLVLLVAVASVSAFGPPSGRVWCTCRWPKCHYGEFVLDKQCHLFTPLFPWHWKTCCKWLPWWATNKNYGSGPGGGGGVGIGGIGGGVVGGSGGSLGGSLGGGGYGKKY